MKSLFKGAAAIALGAGVAFAGQASAAELKLGHFMSPKHPMHVGVFTPLAKKVAEESGGSLTIKIFDSGKLGRGPAAQFKRTKEGAFDIGFVIIGLESESFPRTLLAGKPGVGKTAADVATNVWNVYDKFLKDEFKDVQVLGIWANYPSAIISKKPIRKPSDMKNLVVRVPSKTDIPTVEAWGAKASQIPITQTYDAFQKGTVDVVYIAPAALYRPWNLHQPASHVTFGIKGSAALFLLGVNKGSWNKLSKEHQALIKKHTGREFSINASKYWQRTDEFAFKQVGKQKGLEVINLTPAEAKAFDDLTDAVVKRELDEAAKGGLPAHAIFNSLIN
ncbi:MAG: TRAP transporter substrate-binding protein [Rhodospirillales bacterium]|nr:TRAP transporter substrate-binding protein [Rhodospirillales bacterium]